MKTATFSDFRNNAKQYFDEVEKGEIIQIYRHGKPVAIISPVGHKDISRWKDAKPLTIPGVSLSKAILSEREEQ
ncbi:MAG TPA: type II toxin-antitoxin system Phd/YefM family antitoxin [Spirochaetota bacterium]|nr:type II toxin-antitoxin system Phd/YefM family antitoxin [Spirochaetota bacterium]HPI90898.1 type II toxin-antitoxin system Phd/YefM family antitoxin [Spirochaetota bacterium]HPR48380.1 type II toxin-antitoxin system Phd/YefM family antitoxin [Spirochaetota bacterium]